MHYTWIFTSIYLYFFFAHWTCPTCNKRYQMVLMSPPLLTLTLFAAARATRRPRSRGRSAPSSRTWSGPSSSGSCATATTPTPPRYARGMFGVIRRLRCEDYRLFLSQNLILSQNHVLVSHASVFFSHFFKGLPLFERLSNDAILILRRRLRVCRMTHFKIIKYNSCYPTKAEKLQLAVGSNMTLVQVRTMALMCHGEMCSALCRAHIRDTGYTLNITYKVEDKIQSCHHQKQGWVNVCRGWAEHLCLHGGDGNIRSAQWWSPPDMRAMFDVWRCLTALHNMG